MSKYIWVLLSIANDYNQPYNNLKVWWSEGPSKVQVASAIGVTGISDNFYMNIMNGVEIRVGGTDYRVKKVGEGEVL